MRMRGSPSCSACLSGIWPLLDLWRCSYGAFRRTRTTRCSRIMSSATGVARGAVAMKSAAVCWVCHNGRSDAAQAPARILSLHSALCPAASRVPTGGDGCSGPFREHLLDGVRAGRAAEADVAVRGDLSQAQPSIFDLEIDDTMPDGRWEAAMGIVLLLGGWPEEAAHALRVELVSIAAQRPFGLAGLLCSLGWHIPKQDDGPQQLIRALLGPEAVLFELLPLVRVWARYACWHGKATLPEGRRLRVAPSIAESGTAGKA